MELRSAAIRSVGCILTGCISLCACVSPRETSAGLGDPTYLHCHDRQGDFSISDSRRSLGQYSKRTGGYVALCRGCTVAEWDDRIVLHDSHGTSISLDRISGRLDIQRAGRSPGSDSARAYRGACKRGARIGAGEQSPTTARAF